MIASLRLTYIATLASLSLAVIGDESTTIEVQADLDANNPNTVWIGVYAEPLSARAKAWSWTLVESEQFSLEIPDVDRVTVVALRKDSVPLVQSIEIGKSDPRFKLDFQEEVQIQGIVYSTDGIPVSNATLTVDYEHLRSLNIPDHVRSVWISDSNGRYTIGGIAVGSHFVQVSPQSGFSIESFSIDAQSDQRNSHDLPLTNAYFVTGRVVDHARMPARGVEIKALAVTDSFPDLLVDSDENGEFCLGPFAEGQVVDLSARRSDGASALHSQIIAGRHDIVLRLSDRVGVSAVVVDSVNNEPLNAFSLWEFGGQFPHVQHFVDAEGQLSATVDQSSKGLVIDTVDHTPHIVHPVMLASDSKHDLGVVELQPGRHLNGSVFNAETGHPISGASVVASILQSRRLDWASRESLRNVHMVNRVNTETDTTGTFKLQPLPNHPLAIAVSAPAYEATRVQVGETKSNIDIALKPLASKTTRLRGTLATTSGEPVKGTVSIWNLGTSHGSNINCENGSFDVASQPGTYRVSGLHNLSESDVKEVVLREGETQEIHLVFESKGRLTASIRGLRSAESVLLKIADSNVLNHREARIGENGEHTFEGLGSGTFVLSATTTMRRQIEETFALHGDDGHAKVQLSFEGSSRLHGFVKCVPPTNGEFHVLVTPQDPSAVSSRCATIDGAFDLQGLNDGRYTVAVFPSTQGMLQHTPLALVEAVVAGDTELNIDVTGVALSGTVNPAVDSAGTRVVLRLPSYEAVVGSVVTDHSGIFRFELFPPGTYLLTANHNHFLPYEETLEIGVPVPNHGIQLRIRPLGTLELAGIVNASASVRGARVTLRRASDGTNAGRVRVDRTGRFRFSELQQEEYVLSVLHHGFEPFRAAVTLDQSFLEFEAVLNPMGSLVLAGTVRPVGLSAGARVALERTSDSEFVGSAMTDTQGKFEIVALKPDEYVVHVYHEEFEVLQQELSLRNSIRNKEISLQALKKHAQ